MSGRSPTSMRSGAVVLRRRKSGFPQQLVSILRMVCRTAAWRFFQPRAGDVAARLRHRLCAFARLARVQPCRRGHHGWGAGHSRANGRHDDGSHLMGWSLPAADTRAGFPRYFRIGTHRVSAYKVFLCIGIYIGTLVSAAVAQRSGFSPLLMGVGAWRVPSWEWPEREFSTSWCSHAAMRRSLLARGVESGKRRLVFVRRPHHRAVFLCADRLAEDSRGGLLGPHDLRHCRACGLRAPGLRFQRLLWRKKNGPMVRRLPARYPRHSPATNSRSMARNRLVAAGGRGTRLVLALFLAARILRVGCAVLVWSGTLLDGAAARAAGRRGRAGARQSGGGRVTGSSSRAARCFSWRKRFVRWRRCGAGLGLGGFAGYWLITHRRRPMHHIPGHPIDCNCLPRRGFLRMAAAATVTEIGGGFPVCRAGPRRRADQGTTRQDDAGSNHPGNEERKQALSEGRRKDRNYLREQKASASGQYPAAALLSCIDSRAPAEVIMDLGIGDIFNCRVAGNVENADILAAWSSPANWPGQSRARHGSHRLWRNQRRDRQRRAGQSHRITGQDQAGSAGDALFGRTLGEELRFCGCCRAKEC